MPDSKEMKKDAQRSRLEIADYILGYIRDNNLHENGKLPSNSVLAAQFQVNRSIIRGAMEHLRSQGRIYSQKGKGFFVAPRMRQVVFHHFSDVGFSETFQSPEFQYESKLLKWSLVDADEQKTKRMGLEKGEKLYRLKILRSVKGLPLAVCHSEIPQRLVPGFEAWLSGFYSLNDILLHHYGYAHPVCTSISVSAAMPSADEIKLLQIGDNLPILMEVNLFEIPGIGPVEHFIIRARSDRFKLSFD